MYTGGMGGGMGAGAATTVAGVALLPNTGGRTLLSYVAVIAIVGGAAALVAQLLVAAYRRSALKK